MNSQAAAKVANLATREGDAIAGEWFGQLQASGIMAAGRMSEAELRAQCRHFLHVLQEATDSRGIERMRETLADVSRQRASLGFSPVETATFVFSLKLPLFHAIDRLAEDSPQKTRDVWDINLFVDELGLFTIEMYQRTREEVIIRQQREISELSTPVVKLWDGILALPIIGTLDSERTQSVMENLLQTIVDESAEIAIVDITGVPTVDTLTAQHLLKTVAAARLMGADCIISGIRPQIAQTMVHLGVELNVVTKATLADAFAVALRRLGRRIVPMANGPQSAVARADQAAIGSA